LTLDRDEHGGYDLNLNMDAVQDPAERKRIWTPVYDAFMKALPILEILNPARAWHRPQGCGI